MINLILGVIAIIIAGSSVFFKVHRKNREEGRNNKMRDSISDNGYINIVQGNTYGVYRS